MLEIASLREVEIKDNLFCCVRIQSHDLRLHAFGFAQRKGTFWNLVEKSELLELRRDVRYDNLALCRPQGKIFRRFLSGLTVPVDYQDVILTVEFGLADLLLEEDAVHPENLINFQL